MAGGPGDDSLAGNGGSDFLDGGTDADDLWGGDGRDTATYSDHPSAVTVTIDDVADDGNATDSFADNVRTDVESLIATDDDDTLDSLDGNAGTIMCGGGTDALTKDPFDTAIGCENVL